MKYFTPELYLRFNSADERVADAADSEWETAIGQYKRYLREHRNQLPPHVRTLAEKCCFHDAVLLRRQKHEHTNSVACGLLTMGLLHGDQTIVLCYFLSESPRETRRRKSWPFSSAQKLWLYDEVGVEGNVASASRSDDFVHRILWSDGSELEIPFVDVIIDEFPSVPPLVSDQRASK